MSKRVVNEQLDQDAQASFIEEHGRVPDAQELHDWMNRDRKASASVSCKRRRAVLATPMPAPPFYGSDPIKMALANHPGLTLEKALKDEEDLGF